jgi:hypothetical protein
MIQVVECPPSKCEAPHSNSSTTHKKKKKERKRKIVRIITDRNSKYDGTSFLE